MYGVIYIPLYQITQCTDIYVPNYTMLDTKKKSKFDNDRLRA